MQEIQAKSLQMALDLLKHAGVRSFAIVDADGQTHGDHVVREAPVRRRRQRYCMYYDDAIANAAGDKPFQIPVPAHADPESFRSAASTALAKRFGNRGYRTDLVQRGSGWVVDVWPRPKQKTPVAREEAAA